jgi:large subunit ribosomal protein L2
MKKFLPRIKQLSYGSRQSGGRTNHGPITSPRRGSLVKQSYRFIDLKRTMVTGRYGALIVERDIYDPNRSARISLIMTSNGILTYILAAEMSSEQTTVFNLRPGKRYADRAWSNYLRLLPLGSIIHNCELRPKQGGQIARSAGNFAVVLAKKMTRIKPRVVLKLKSGETRAVSPNCLASVGVVGNHTHFLRNYKTAGTTRLYGIRPRVRPSAMNPVDHPMAGRTRGGCAPQSKQGRLSHGVKTSPKKPHSLIITSARKSRLKKKKYI